MKKHLNRSLLLLLAVVQFACKADVELTEVDPNVKLGFGAALPVGEMSLELGNFLGGDFSEAFIVREDGVLCFYDSVNMEFGLDEVDITDYFEPAHAELVVGDLIPDKLIEIAAMMGIPLHWRLPGSDEPIVLECPIDLTLGGINEPGSTERIDKVILALAEFGAIVTQQHMDMPFDKIESVELILPDRMQRTGGQIVLAQLDGKDYGQNVPIVIDNCVIDLVKDHSKALGTDNAIDTLSLNLRFTLSLEKTDIVTIYADSKFVFDFALKDLDYDAIYGYFETTGLGTEKMDISFADMLPIWDQLGSFKLPFADPRIDLSVTTGIGAPMAAHIEHLVTTDRKDPSKKAYATWTDELGNTSTSTNLIFTNLVQPDDPLDKETTNTFHLSKDPAEGHIDNLFTVEPEKLEFEYNVFIADNPLYPQMRITDKTDVKVEAEMTMPFEFNPGVELAYTDTMHVEINKISLDSLIENTPIKDVEIDTLYMIVTAMNTLPFNIQLQMTPLDASGNVVMPMQPILIAAPSEWDAAKGELVPGSNKIVVSVSEDKLEKLSEVKTLLYTATLCDTDLAEGMKNVPAEAYPIGLDRNGKFAFKIGIGASVDVYLDLSEMFKK